MSGDVDGCGFLVSRARSGTRQRITQRCGGSAECRTSGGWSGRREEAPVGCCSRGVNWVKGVDASTLGLPELSLTTVVRCVVSSTEGRVGRPPRPVGRMGKGR